MDRRRWLSQESQSKLNRGIEQFLLNWSEFRTALDLLPGIKKEQCCSDVLQFFAATAEPNVDALATMLYGSLQTRLHGVVNFHTCEKAAEQLLTLYHGCSLDKDFLSVEKDGDMADQRSLSVGSKSKFKESIHRVLSEWESFQIILAMLGRGEEFEIRGIIFRFFSRTTEPNVDGVAEMLHRAICTELDALVDFSACKKAAQPLLNIHQGCLNGNFNFLEILGDAKSPTEVVEKACA